MHEQGANAAESAEEADDGGAKSAVPAEPRTYSHSAVPVPRIASGRDEPGATQGWRLEILEFFTKFFGQLFDQFFQTNPTPLIRFSISTESQYNL